jgi:hypothetical protein
MFTVSPLLRRLWTSRVGRRTASAIVLVLLAVVVVFPAGSRVDAASTHYSLCGMSEPYSCPPIEYWEDCMAFTDSAAFYCVAYCISYSEPFRTECIDCCMEWEFASYAKCYDTCEPKP